MHKGKHTQQGMFPRCLGQVFPALQGLKEIHEHLQSRRANLVLCSQSGCALCVWSAGTRKVLRTSSKVAAKRSALAGLSWPG